MRNIRNILQKDEAAPPPPPSAYYAKAPTNTSDNPTFTPAPLKHLADIESSGHKNRVHALQTGGIHAGTRAVSSYGLMPATLKEIATKHKPLRNSELGQQILAAKTPEEINKITYHQPHDDALAKHAWEYTQSRLLKNAPGVDKQQLENLTVYAHRNGINAALKAHKTGTVTSHPYVQKYSFLKLKDRYAALPKPTTPKT